MLGDFTIRLLNQFWLDDCEEDLCSHGEILIKVCDNTICNQTDGEWVVIDSALALLETVICNFPSDELLNQRKLLAPIMSRAYSEREHALIYHCSRTMLYCLCKITWRVKHAGGNVILSDFIKYPDTSGKRVSYPGLVCEIPLKDYASQIYDFALTAKLFYQDHEKSLNAIETGEIFQGQYEELWNEFNELLLLVERQIQ